VFTIPFDEVSSLARIAGLLFFSTCLFYPRLCFRRPPQALWWFAGYVSVYVLNGLFIPEQFIYRFIERLQTLIQLLVFCWIGSTLLREEKMARHTLLTFSIATLFAATGMLLGLPGFVETWGGRMSTAGANPNGLAVLMGLTAQALIGFGIDQTLRNIWMRVTCMIMSFLPLMAMVYTGSRGGIIAFLTGVVVYALPYCGSKRKMVAVLGIAIAVVGVIYVVINDSVTLSRFERSYYTGATAHRDTIYAAAIEMISAEPLLGWGPIVFNYELMSRTQLGSRTGYKGIDAHNLFFHLLLEGGLFGTIPFLIGFGLCVQATWTARFCSLGLLPLVWLITMIVANISGTWLTAKIFWLVLALDLASGAFIVKQHKRRNIIIRTILQHS